jgi:hypothetical protein
MTQAPPATGPPGSLPFPDPALLSPQEINSAAAAKITPKVKFGSIFIKQSPLIWYTITPIYQYNMGKAKSKGVVRNM